MELWIVFSIGAALLQNIRMMLQKHLSENALSTAGTVFSRYLFGAPLAVILVSTIVIYNPDPLPNLNRNFLTFVLFGGASQLVGTFCMVRLFRLRNFTVGIVLQKSEIILAAIFGFAILGDKISKNGFLAISLGGIGLIILSYMPNLLSKKSFVTRFLNQASLFGLIGGVAFAVSAISFRGASLSIETGGFIIRSSLTLLFAIVFQTSILISYLYLREKGEMRRVFFAWRIMGLVGLTSMLGSAAWFMAFSLQNAAYVSLVGQIGLVFSFIGSYLVFKEYNTQRELLGIILVMASIIVLIVDVI